MRGSTEMDVAAACDREGAPPLIAHVIYRLDVGGLENGVVNLINAMPPERFRHAIVSLTGATSFRDRIERNVPVICLNKREGKDLHLYVRLWRAIRRLRPDIVHTRNLATAEAVVPAWLAGVAGRIHSEHGWDIADLDGRNRRYRNMRRFLKPFVHRYIALSRHIEAYLLDSIGVDPLKMDQIYNGVDRARFRPARDGRPALPCDGAMRPGGFVIGWVGRMAAVKDPLNLVEAFIHLKSTDARARREARLVLVGDGPLRVKAERRLREARLLHHAWLPGRRDDVPELMRGFDLFVLPSRAEGISNTVLEAMASGLPVVATDVGGNPEIVEHGRTGVLVPRDNPYALGEAIGDYLDDAVLCGVHGRNARERVVADFSLEKMVARYVGIYESLLPEGKRAVPAHADRTTADHLPGSTNR